MEESAAATVTRHAMGTVMSHKAFGRLAEDSLTAVCSEVARLEGLLSRFLAESEISRINRSAGMGRAPISRETHDVLSAAAELSARVQGCFDVTIGPLVTLWQAGKQAASPPDAASLRQALPLVNHRELILDARHMTAGLVKRGQSIDLGGIGKGFAADRIAEVFRKFGIRSAYSNLGGNVVAVGTKPDGSAWRIGIQHPREEERLIGSVAVVDQTVVTSGDYQRYYTDGQGERQHHILDPRTGTPAQAGLISVSIVASRSVVADSLSTAVFVAGMDKGLEFVRSLPHTEAILVDSELNVYVTQGLRYRFQADRGVGVTILD